MADEKKAVPGGGEEIEAPGAETEAPAKVKHTPEGLPTLLQQFARGETDAETVANSIRKDDPSRPSGDLTYEQREKRALDDDYGDPHGTFAEVVAAWIGGDITDAQYNEIREAFVPEGATTGEEDEAGEEEVPEDAEAPEAPPA